MDTHAVDFVSVADLFGTVWTAVADLLGTAATAAMVRRTTRRAVRECPSLEGLSIASQNFTYEYMLPAHWHAPATVESLAELRTFMREFVPVLSDLTGPVVVRRLARLPACTEYRLFDTGERSS